VFNANNALIFQLEEPPYPHGSRKDEKNLFHLMPKMADINIAPTAIGPLYHESGVEPFTIVKGIMADRKYVELKVYPDRKEKNKDMAWNEAKMLLRAGNDTFFVQRLAGFATTPDARADIVALNSINGVNLEEFMVMRHTIINTQVYGFISNDEIKEIFRDVSMGLEVR
jgi:hypothetical protein